MTDKDTEHEAPLQISTSWMKPWCEDVRKALERSYPICKSEPNTIVIGIFDHDSAGLMSYGSLDQGSFDEVVPKQLKKHKNGNIYGLVIPVPGEMDVYLQDKQEFNFFELEHYMGLEFLKDVVKETSIPGVFEITGDKMALMRRIKKETSPKMFAHFSFLFQEIDKLAGVSIDYLE